MTKEEIWKELTMFDSYVHPDLINTNLGKRILQAMEAYAQQFTHPRKGLTDDIERAAKELLVSENLTVRRLIEYMRSKGFAATRPAITEGELIEIMKNKIALRSWNEPPRLVNGDIVGWELAAAAILTAITPKT